MPFPVEIVLSSPQGAEYSSVTLLPDARGHLSYDKFAIPAEQPSGVWTFAVKTPGKDGRLLGGCDVKVEQERQAMLAAERARPRTGTPKMLTLPGGATMEMIYVESGEFLMGSPLNEDGRYDDETQHRVKISKGFWLGKYEVTQSQWKSVIRSNPSHFKARFKGDNLPVENVSWDDCQAFVSKVNSKLNCGARLPTEAEWEYACRAGTTDAYAGYSLEVMGWCYGNSGCVTHPVGQKQANAWGFYDMHGNVYEWCNDWYGDYPSWSFTDSYGPTSGSDRVLRGGSWFNFAQDCRSAYRYGRGPGDRSELVGFRLCCSAVP